MPCSHSDHQRVRCVYSSIVNTFVKHFVPEKFSKKLKMPKCTVSECGRLESYSDKVETECHKLKTACDMLKSESSDRGENKSVSIENKSVSIENKSEQSETNIFKLGNFKKVDEAKSVTPSNSQKMII